MCDVVHSLGKVLKNLIWRQATSGIAVGMHTPRRHPVDSAPWTNSFQRPTPWWRETDSNLWSPVRRTMLFEASPFLTAPGTSLAPERRISRERDRGFESAFLHRRVPRRGVGPEGDGRDKSG